MIPANLLSLIIFLPLLGGLVVLAFRRHPNPCRWISLGTASMDLFLILSVYLLEIRVHPAGDWLIVEDTSWIETLGIRYSLGLDGISLLLIMLTSFLGIIVILVSWTQVTSRVALFHFFLLSMQTGCSESSWPPISFSFTFSGSCRSSRCFSLSASGAMKNAYTLP